MMNKKMVSKNEKETKKIATDLAKQLKGGEILMLTGDLGAGKTTFLQELAKRIGVQERVNSPTFNIMKLYKPKNKTIKVFCHIDAYRLDSGKDLKVLGIDEIWGNDDTVTAVEWAEIIKDIYPNHYIKVDIKHISENERELTIDKK